MENVAVAKLRLSIFLCLMLFSAFLAYGQETQRHVEVIQVDGVINPVTAEYLDKAVQKATAEGAEAMVLLLDTPGGLDTSMRMMVKSIIGSPVPVVTYVSPSGAKQGASSRFLDLPYQPGSSEFFG